MEILTNTDVREAAQIILNKTKLRPSTACICGSGLGNLAEILEDRFTIPYADVPNFPVSTVPGHAGQLVFGNYKGKCCVFLQGRTHLYEGYAPNKIVFPVRVLRAIGVDVLIITNAAGGLNETYKTGDLVVVKDHINIPGFCTCNPLVGITDESMGARFPAMSDAYDHELIALAKKTAMGLNIELHEGVYAAVTGPNYETIAEARMFKILGADLIGMSTASEVVAARQVGLRCCVVSLVTNCVIMDYSSQEKANHNEVCETGQRRAADFQKLISTLIGSATARNRKNSENNVFSTSNVYSTNGHTSSFSDLQI